MTAAFPGDHEAGIRVLGERRPRRGVPARLLRLASDERLVEGVRGGSEAAFEVLFDRYHRGVLGFCRHMLGSVEEAEDAVQHTFLSAYRELAGSGKHVVLRPWLYTIARNRCLTMLRGRVWQASTELVEPPTEHLAAAVERRHDLQDLLRDVAGLPEEQRSALVLSEVGDMAHDEIADVLGCRRDKVKALVFQARSSLIASRQARETPCAEIREQLANLRGGSLRRNDLRRHVSECAGCREFRDQVRAQRRDLALVLPVAPTVGLKSGVIGAALGSSAAGPVVATGGSGALAAKVLVAAAIAGGGTVAATEVADRVDRPTRTPAPAGVRTAPAPVQHESSGSSVTPAGPTVTPLRGASDSAPGHAKPAPPGRDVRDSAPGHARRGERPARPAVPEHAGHRAAAPGHVKSKTTGKPEGAGSPGKPPKADKPAKAQGPKPKEAKAPKPAKAAKPGKAPKPAKGSNPGNGHKGAKAPKPPKASKPPEAAKPVAAPKSPKALVLSEPAAPVAAVEPAVRPGKKPK